MSYKISPKLCDWPFVLCFLVLIRMSWISDMFAFNWFSCLVGIYICTEIWNLTLHSLGWRREGIKWWWAQCECFVANLFLYWLCCLHMHFFALFSIMLPLLQGAVVTMSEPKNLVQSNALVPLTSQGINQLEQPGPSDLSGICKDTICNQCGKETRGGSILKCYRCMLPCHISCIEDTDSSISTGRWCCKNCSTADMVLAHYRPNCLHGNCVVCDRLEVCRSPNCEDAPNDNSRAMVISSVDSFADQILPEIDTGYSCKICGDLEEDEKRFLICGHAHCLYKYYHIQCLKSKQIASDVQQDKPCWYCPSCLCRVCLSDKDDDLTILCDGCDEAYHLYCITPRRTSVPKGQWYCSTCSVERAKEGMKQYERRMLKLHRKDDAELQSRNDYGLDLLLFAAEQLRVDEKLVSRTD